MPRPPLARRPCRSSSLTVTAMPAVLAAIVFVHGNSAGAQNTVHPPLPPPSAESAGATIQARSAGLAGFERRRLRGHGVFITSADLARRRPARLSDVLRVVPGVALVNVPGGGHAVASARHGWHRRSGLPAAADRACYMDVLLDGVPLTLAPATLPLDIDAIVPRRLAGIEIHPAIRIPVDLRVSAGSCGVIALWSASS